MDLHVRVLTWVFSTIVVLLLVLAGIALFILQDPNRFKPQLVELIANQTGVPVRIDGELAWQLFPPVSLSAEAIQADHEGTQYQLAKLSLDVDLTSVLKTRDLDRWRVRSLRLDGLQMHTGKGSDSTVTHIEYLTLNDFTPGQPSPFSTQLTYRSGDGATVPVSLEGLLSVASALDEIAVSKGKFATTQASGECDLNARATGKVVGDTAGSLVPVSILQAYDWTSDCLLDRVTYDDQEFHNVTLELKNSAGASTSVVAIPEFFGGSAQADLEIDTRPSQVAWLIQPDLQNVDSQALLAWLDQDLQWIAPLAYGGSLTMQGNTEAELVNSVRADTQFDGGKGQISITQIKQPLLALATLFNEGERVQKWPDPWDYERMTGDWQIDGKQHALNFSLDNLTAAMNGTYDALTDELNMQLEVTFQDNPGMHSFDVNPLLIGLPIPFQCVGSLDNPSCRVDPAATQRLVASVLRDSKGQELIDELDRKIDEDVPEEYREAARSLLDLLGGALKKPPQD